MTFLLSRNEGEASWVWEGRRTESTDDGTRIG